MYFLVVLMNTKKQTNLTLAILSAIFPAKMQTNNDNLPNQTANCTKINQTKPDVPIYTLRQEPGEFVVTFPRAYHAGFSHGECSIRHELTSL